MNAKPLVLLLPGLDGTGRLFGAFLEAISSDLEPMVVTYPCDRALGYADLEDYVRERCPGDRPFVMIAESFSGPVALRLAAKNPPGLVALVLVATFVRAPVHRAWSALHWILGRFLFLWSTPETVTWALSPPHAHRSQERTRLGARCVRIGANIAARAAKTNRRMRRGLDRG